jgi:hypothetical protein
VIHEQVAPRTLGAARVLVFGLWFINISSVHLEDYLTLPRELLSRYGVLYAIPPAVWDAMWNPVFVVGLRFTLLALLAWLILGLGRYRAIAIATCIGITLFDAMAKSLGHINHSKFGILFAAWILAAFPANDDFALRPRKGPPEPPVFYVAPMLAMATLIFLTYSFVGAFRIGSGLGVFFSDALGKWFLHKSFEANATGFMVGPWVVANTPIYVLGKIGFVVISVCELLSPLCLVSTRFRWFWIAVLVPFHFMSLLTMNIFFWENVLLILFFATDSNRLFARR